jgi:hypothetical protein
VNPTLIKANIALFNGSRAEARRLLREYEAQTAGAPEAEDATLVLWLSAQAQDSREGRVDGLRKLLATAPASDPYAKLAHQYLADEEKAKTEAETATVPEEGEAAAPRRGGILGVPWWKAAAFAGVGVVLGVIVMTLFAPGGGPGQGVAVAPTSAPGTPSVAVRGTPLPDLSTPIAPELHQTIYPRGILQVSRIEDGSQRVADRNNNLIGPVTGTRYVALKLVFECRQGTCSRPPEANLSLFLDDGSLAGQLTDVSVLNEPQLEPVGENFSSDGWVVFQVPDARDPLALAVLPFLPIATPENNQEPEPQLIPLGLADAEVTPDVNNP